MSDTLGDIFTRLAVINAAITGVKKATKYPPVSVATADLPLAYARWVGARSLSFGGLSQAMWEIEIVVLVDAIAQGGYDENMAALIVFPEVMRDLYAGRIHLNDGDGNELNSGDVSLAAIEYMRNEPVILGDTAYSAVHMNIIVKDLTAVTVSG